MYLDIFLVVVMIISGLLAMVRGLIREILSIAGWGAAAVAALFAYAKVLPAAKNYFSAWNEYVVAGATLATAFIGTLVVVSVMTVKISDKSLDSRIGALDRTLGFLFGLARGLLIVVVMFAFYDWFQPKSQPAWIANAKSLVVLKNLRDDIISMSPDIEAWYSRYKKQKEGAAAEPAVLAPRTGRPAVVIFEPGVTGRRNPRGAYGRRAPAERGEAATASRYEPPWMLS